MKRTIYAWVKIFSCDNIYLISEKILQVEKEYHQKIEGLIVEIQDFDFSDTSVQRLREVTEHFQYPIFFKNEVVLLSDFDKLKNLGVGNVILADALLSNPMLSEQLYEKYGQDYLCSWVVTQKLAQGYFVGVNQLEKFSDIRVSAWLTRLDQLAVKCVFIAVENLRSDISILKYAANAVNIPTFAVLNSSSKEDVNFILEQASVFSLVLKLQ